MKNHTQLQKSQIVGVGGPLKRANKTLFILFYHFAGTNSNLSVCEFDVVFLVQLVYVGPNMTLAEAIKLQHDKLDDIPTEHISAIIRGKTKLKVLMIKLVEPKCRVKSRSCRDLDGSRSRALFKSRTKVIIGFLNL